MKIFLTALGCRLNEAELETWSREFAARGHRLATEAASADVVVINTCAVTDEAVRKSRKLLRRTHRDNPNAKLVVSGCYATLNPSEPDTLPGVDLVVANQDKSRLVALVSDRLDLPTMPRMATEPGENLLLARGLQRAFVKVQDGCRYRCSYCIVTQARGEEHSRPLDQIIHEVNDHHESGIQEVVLAGVHLGGYGSGQGSDIVELVRTLLRETDIPRLRLGSIEPWDLPEDFWPLFESPRFMPHLHLPLQSGSDSVLRRMSRRCKNADFSQLLQQARSQVADFNVTTDIIVGFPGETEQEWQQTLEAVAKMYFGHIHIFAFSPRTGTKAATLPHQIDEPTKRRRCQQLAQLAQEQKMEVLADYVGRTLPVLVEGQSGQEARLQGYSPNFLRTRIMPRSQDDPIINRIVDVRIEGIENGDHLLGSVI